MTIPPGSARLTSTTARPAENRTDTEGPDPAFIRRTVGAVVTVTGCRRKEARERITAWVAGGRPLAEEVAAQGERPHALAGGRDAPADMAGQD